MDHAAQFGPVFEWSHQSSSSLGVWAAESAWTGRVNTRSWAAEADKKIAAHTSLAAHLQTLGRNAGRQETEQDGVWRQEVITTVLLQRFKNQENAAVEPTCDDQSWVEVMKGGAGLQGQPRSAKVKELTQWCWWDVRPSYNVVRFYVLIWPTSVVSNWWPLGQIWPPISSNLAHDWNNVRKKNVIFLSFYLSSCAP